MANLFKRAFSKGEEEDNVKDKEEEKEKKSGENKGVELELSMGPVMDERTSKVVKDMHIEELKSFPEIKEGDINISSSYLYDNGKTIEVSLYVRNAFKKAINFELLPLMIVNSKGEVLSRQVFDARELGEIPSMTARPWKIFFDKKNFKEGASLENCRVVFDAARMKIKNPMEDIHFEDFPREIENDEKVLLNDIIRDLGPLKENEVNVLGFKMEQNSNGGIRACIIIRNGSKKQIRIEKLPLSLLDTMGKVAARKEFNFDDLYLNPKCAKVVFVDFHADSIINSDADFTTWRIVGAR